MRASLFVSTVLFAFSVVATGCGDDAPASPSDDAGAAGADTSSGDTGADAATSDAGASDAGSTDAGPADTGAVDSGSTDTGLADAGPTDAGTTDTGATDTGVTDAGNTDAGGGDTGTTDAGADAGEDAAPVTTAALVGTISRSTDPARGADAVGDVFIALFENEPILDRDQMPVAFMIVEDVDLSDRISTVPYRLEGIEPRAGAYFVSAFLDDNGNASVDAAGPDRGDLVMLERFVPPASRQITIPEPGDVTYVIDLNNVLPF